MFDRPLKYNQVGTRTGEQNTTVRLFAFKTPKNRHIITEAHIYEAHHLVIIKFFDKAHKDSDNRFSLMSNSGEAVNIIRTAVQIMIDLHDKNPYFSFAFMGATDLGETDKNQTKRFRIYRGVMARFFSKTHFKHRQNSKHSLYIMMNRHYTDNAPDKVKGIFKLLEKAYPKEE